MKVYCVMSTAADWKVSYQIWSLVPLSAHQTGGRIWSQCKEVEAHISASTIHI